MFGSPFYHSTMKKMMAAFGSLFNSIHVVRRHSNGNEKERIKVPLAYGPAQKYLIKTQQDPDLDQNFALKLPRMSFEIKVVQYDANRKLNTIKINTQPTPEFPNKVLRQYQGVPYNIGIDLMVMSKNIDDANQIVEQILPWFTPTYSVTVNTIPGMEYQDDVHVTLRSLQMNDNYEGDFVTRRDVMWTLSFDLRTWFYGPIKDKNLITRVQTDILAAPYSLNMESPSARETVPRIARIVTEPENPNATYEEDFGYTQETNYLEDGLRYDPVTGTDVEAMWRIRPKGIKTKERVGKAKLV